MKERHNNLDFLKIKKQKTKNLCSVKHNVSRMRSQARDWEKIFANTHLIKDCYLKYAKNSLNSRIRKPTTPLKNGQKTLTYTLPNKIYRWQIYI